MGWDPEFITSQDSDLSMRLLEHDYAVARTPKTYVRMAKRSKLTNWWKMGHRYGFWRMKTVRKHPTRASLRNFTLVWIGDDTMSDALETECGSCSSIALFVRVACRGLTFFIQNKTNNKYFRVPSCLLMLHTSFSIGLLDGLFRKGRAPTDR